MRPLLTMVWTVSLTLLTTFVAEAHPPEIFYPETPAGLEQQIGDLLSAAEEGRDNLLTTHVRRLVIPSYRVWFATVFGSHRCRPLIDEYDEHRHDFASMNNVFREVIAKGQTEVTAFRLSDADDLRARGLQKRAFQAMRHHQDLYTVAMTRSGERTGTKLWSFVYVNGSFRFAGKMNELTKISVEIR